MICGDGCTLVVVEISAYVLVHSGIAKVVEEARVGEISFEETLPQIAAVVLAVTELGVCIQREAAELVTFKSGA